MNLYAESSAVLAWLLDEAQSQDVLHLLIAAQAVVASDLTLIECDRVLLRAAALGELTEGEAADRCAHLTTAASQWHLLRISPEIVDRARQPFPGEPIRTLDAIHLVTARAEGFERVYSNDRHLLAAAKSFGLEGVNPISR